MEKNIFVIVYQYPNGNILVDLVPTFWKIYKNHINPQHPLGHSPIFIH